MSKKTVISNGVEWESVPISIPEDYMEYFDFVDLGAKNGKMEKYAQETFNGQKGLHFEIEEECIKVMEEKGIPCVQADITNLTLPENCVDFVIATGTVEHLMNLESVKKMIEMSIIAAKDFIYLTWPWFDSDEYLESLGLTLFASTWDGHTTHVTISDLRNILDELSVEGTFMAWPLIPNSSSENISPIGAIEPELGGTAEYGNLGPYKSKYGPKPMVNFTEPVYYESVCFISLRDSQRSRESLEVIKQFNWDKV
tara:strand:- start:504 stop:1268 length:765 start_codon:yes stop_codon:yes gene_type:complete